MSIKQSDYETLLADYSAPEGAIALLKQHRPYLEMLPSLRRPDESLITIPLPVVRLRNPKSIDGSYPSGFGASTVTQLPCDLIVLMCDPEWKVKMGAEIVVFIHRPQEDFSDLLRRWRQSQVYLSQDYEWLMPPRHEHILSEGAEKIYPLFVLFEGTLKRIKRGLTGANLPFVTQNLESLESEETTAVLNYEL
jgi:hypothetical protein